MQRAEASRRLREGISEVYEGAIELTHDDLAGAGFGAVFVPRIGREGGKVTIEGTEFNFKSDGVLRRLRALARAKAIWDAALWLQASLGDTFFEQQQYERALAHFLDARASADGAGNPFVALRLGECYFELGRGEEAKRSLLQAHMTEGDESFEAEDPKYLEAIRAELTTRGNPRPS